MTTIAQRIADDTAHAERMRLADAAPELLAALAEMLADADTMNEPYRNEAICERARAAIAKATGEHHD